MKPRTHSDCPSLEALVALAVDGDADALEAVLRRIKDDVYGLAIRMLFVPADAEDATQEILVRVVTKLSSFEGRSTFRTWVYRVAVRSLLNTKRSAGEHPLSFDEFGADLLDGLGERSPRELSEPERAVLHREVRIACTQAMLLCLDRDHRLAYLLGVVFELDGPEAAECLGISAPAYRKRLSRARQRVNGFLQKSCGLVSSAAACRCARRVAPALNRERIDPAQLLFATHPVVDAADDEVAGVVDRLEALCAPDELMQSGPVYRAPERLLVRLRVQT